MRQVELTTLLNNICHNLGQVWQSRAIVKLNQSLAKSNHYFVDLRNKDVEISFIFGLLQVKVVPLAWNEKFYLPQETGNYSVAGFKLNMERKMTHYIITYYLPSGLFVVVSWASFLIPSDDIQVINRKFRVETHMIY